MSKLRTVAPIGPIRTGHPWAFTQNVAATPKSLFDCMTLGPNPKRIKRGNHLRPSRARVDPVNAVCRIRFDPAVVIGDGMSIGRNRLPAHRMPRGTHVERPAIGLGLTQLGPDGGHERVAGIIFEDRMSENRGFAEPTGVVQCSGGPSRL